MTPHDLVKSLRSKGFHPGEDSDAWLIGEIEKLLPRWQPIETAPKDGTPIILYLPPNDNSAVSGCIEGAYFSSPKETDDGWETIIGFLHEPTYWLPLPPPPQE